MYLDLVKDVSLLVNAIGAGNCFLLSYVYIRKKEGKVQQSGYILSLLFFILGLVIFNTIFNFTGRSQLFYGFEPLTNALIFAIAPLLFLYVKSQGHASRTVWIRSKHLLLFYTILFLTIVAFGLPESTFGALGQLIVKSKLIRILWNVHFLGYLIMTINEFRKKNTDQWGTQRILVWGIASIWFFNLLFYLYNIWINPIPTAVYLNITLLFSGMTLWLFYQKLGVVETNGRGKMTKIKKTLSQNKENDPLLVTINEKKYYKDPNLDIRTLSEQLQLPYHELSARINQEYSQNFNEFINSFRIQEVVYALQTEQHQSYTIMGLAQEAGFKSASAFYAAFKKEKGTTPTHFIEHSVKAL